MDGIFLYDKYDLDFAKDISNRTKISISEYKILKFNNGELIAQISSNVEEKNVYILVKTSKDITNFQNIIFVTTEVFNKKKQKVLLL